MRVWRRLRKRGDVAFFEQALEERQKLVDELTNAAIRARVPRCAPP